MRLIMQVLMLILVILFNVAYADNQQKDIMSDKIDHTDFYKKIAISQVKTTKNVQFYGYKIAIHTYKLKSNPENTPGLPLPGLPVLDQLIWEITPDQLPVTETQCNEETMDLCKDMPWRRYCFKPCLSNGPKIIIFDEKQNKLYMYIDTTAVGSTGIGPRFTFVADISNKKITPLTSKTIDTPGLSTLSPSGKYLLIYGLSWIDIINTDNGEIDTVSIDDNERAKKDTMHFLGEIKWLSDTQFSYQDGIRHGRYQDSFDAKQENIYDIPTKRIMHTRNLAKTEYDSTPYDNDPD